MKRVLNVVLCIGCFQCVQFKPAVDRLIKPIKLYEDIKNYDGVLKEKDRNIMKHSKLVPKMVTINYVKLPVDHFNKNNNDKWDMRILQNKMFFKPDSPIYLIIGGDESLSEELLTQGYIFELAEETNGAIYATEHRYYGKSHIHDDLKYLHSTQAIEDLRGLIKVIRNGQQYSRSKVVLIGGGYAGSLAVWMKQIYPGEIDVVVASSAPLLAVTEFEQYATQAVKTFMQKGHTSCLKRIKEVFEYYISSIKTNNFKELATYSNICPNVDMGQQLNQQMFFLNELALLMAGIEDGLIGLKSSCMFFEKQHRPVPKSWNTKQKEIFEKGRYITALLPQGDCLNLDFEDLIIAFHQDEYKENKYRLYQTCNEFGSFPTTSFVQEPFDTLIPAEFYYKLCAGVFGPEFDEKGIERKVNETNSRYKGLKPNVTRVVFVTGEIDPWKSLGVSDKLNTQNEFIEITGESHSSDLKPSFMFDEKPLTFARIQIKQTVKKWLQLKK